MITTVVLGVAAAFCWGVPDLWLAQASRKVGPVAVCFGSILVGVLVGIAFGGERLLRRQVAGIVLVLVAVSVIAASGG